MFPCQAIRVFMFFTLLFFLLNSYILFNFLDIIRYILNYIMDLEFFKLYYNMIKPTGIIFEIRLFFMSNFIKVIKKIRVGKTKNRFLLILLTFWLYLPTIIRLPK